MAPQITHLYISRGNSKTGKIPTFSLPAVMTCPGMTPYCQKICYAKRDEIRFPNVRIARLRNFVHIINRPLEWQEEIIAWIKRYKPKYFRVHEGGDFFAQRYLDDWFYIAESCPNTRFMAYTKSFFLDYSKKPDNFVIYWSIMPDTPKEKIPKRGLYAYTECGPSSAFICPYKAVPCSTCLYCYLGLGDVRFTRH